MYVLSSRNLCPETVCAALLMVPCDDDAILWEREAEFLHVRLLLWFSCGGILSPLFSRTIFHERLGCHCATLKIHVK